MNESKNNHLFIIFTLTASLIIILLLNSGNFNTHTNFTIDVIETYPHDMKAFTQGLVYHNGFLYESTGLWGKSSLRKVDLETGVVLKIHNLSSNLFGEGICIYDNRIFQLTWKSNIGFIYDINTFQPVTEFQITNEGWGLTHDGSRLILSNGTSILSFFDIETHALLKTIKVRYKGMPIEKLNELEYVEGEIWANIWLKDKIVRIEPETGNVIGWIELSSLRAYLKGEQVDVLNGIAYDETENQLYVTGKLWPHIFKIKIDSVG